ncbi:MAG: crossover junction endodeoxyribonuclease RuvC [Atribacterota bacterium]
MKVLGIDPGIALTGFGLLDVEGNTLRLLHAGCIVTAEGLAPEKRLRSLFEDLGALFATYAPEEVAVEELFFNRNAKTAFSVGAARGVVLLCAALHGVPVYEYTPLEVKQAVVGYGRATKPQVAYMVRQILNCESIPGPDDVTDALAVAVCHAFRLRMRNV